MPRKTLRAISHETINELFQKYEFALPSLYQSMFHEKAAQRGVNLESFTIEEEIKKLIFEADKKIEVSTESFSKLMVYAQQAKTAMETKNHHALNEIVEKTTEMICCLKGEEEQLYCDSLTGLLNQKGLMRHIVTPSQSMGLNGIMVMVDIDNFKMINAKYGHSLGDAVLKRFSLVVVKALENIPQKSKFIARLNGDEFVAIVDEQNMDYIKTQFRKLQKNGLVLKIKGEEEKINFSFGSTVFANGKKYVDVLNKANEDMYQNKMDRKKIW